jgi:hypothetical protein
MYLGHAEVAHLEQLPARSEEDVLSLEVAVQNLAVVHVLHGQAQLYEHVEDSRLTQRTSPLAFYQLVQVSAWLADPTHSTASRFNTTPACQ